MSKQTEQDMPMSWYATLAAGGAQGLVIDEKTGANIAVVYDPKNRDIIATSPALLRSLKLVLADLEYLQECVANNSLAAYSNAHSVAVKAGARTVIAEAERARS